MEVVLSHKQKESFKFSGSRVQPGSGGYYMGRNKTLGWWDEPFVQCRSGGLVTAGNPAWLFRRNSHRRSAERRYIKNPRNSA